MSELDLDGPAERPVVLRRLHPLTPFIRGWKVYAAFAAVVAQQSLIERQGRTSLALIVLALAVPIAALTGFVGWRFTTYGFTGEDLRIDSGFLVRRSRRVRLDRLQAVDMVRPLAAKLVGLVELRLEVVGGSGSEGSLAYLSESEATALRAELLARAAGLGANESDVAREEAPEHVLHEVPWGRFLASLLMSVPLLLAAVLGVVVLAGSVAFGTLAPLIALGPVVLISLQAVALRGLSDAGFTVSGSPDGLRLRHGLLETRQQTVPPGRVQAVRVVAPVLWRLKGWVRLEIAVAGYEGTGTALTGTLLPVAPREEALALLHLVLAAEVREVPDLHRLDLAPAPARARWLDPLGRSVLGVAATPEVLLTQHGALRRVLDVVPHAKVQSVRLVQGPLQRRLGLATVHIDLPPHLRPVLPHRDLGEAVRLVAEEVALSRSARARDRGPEWATGFPGR